MEDGHLIPLLYFPHYHRLENGNFGMIVFGQQDPKEYPGKREFLMVTAIVTHAFGGDNWRGFRTGGI